PPLVRAAAPLYFRDLYGVGGIALPPDRFTDFTSYSVALAAYEAEPRVRVLFESGAGTPSGAPVPGFEASLASWPPRATVATTWYFAAGGMLTGSPPTAGSASDAWQYDPAAFPATDAPLASTSGPASATKYNWKPVPKGKAAAYASPPLATDTVMLGTGSVDL